jgi:8-oxo-(d)GTP phosphatase
MRIIYLFAPWHTCIFLSMNLFISDIPIRIIKKNQKTDPGEFDRVLDARKEVIGKALLHDHVLINRATEDHLNAVLKLMNSKGLPGLLSLTISTDDYEAVELFLKKKFKIIKAAGGVIRKKEKFLMMYRMKRWDLPKGKRDPGETNRQTAVREIREECNVEVKLGKKICTTWHTYKMNKKSILKKTKWYAMDLLDDSAMKPSLEEDIEELRWMSKKDVSKALDRSYNSIRFVFEAYYEKFGKKS